MCEKFGLLPLEFDGGADSIYHEFDQSGNRHMEYVNFRGTYAEPPLHEIFETFVANYDHWKDREPPARGDFDAEVEAEVSRA